MSRRSSARSTSCSGRSIADRSPAAAPIRLGAKHMTETLAEKTCTPCRGGVPPLGRDEALREAVSHKVSLLCTDQWKGYKKLDKEYPHATIDHSKGQYVIGAVHTQTIEGFWSIFKRGVMGTFHKMSAKYMPLYVVEFQFRYNNRENADIFGAAIAGC